MARYNLLTNELIAQIAEEDSGDEWLILESHPDFRGLWVVQSLDPHVLFELQDLIGSYRAVSPARLNEFLDRTEEMGLKVAFGEEPEGILDAYEGLDDAPPISLNSNFEDTVGGLLPFQVQGFNFLKDLDGGVALWSTGTGKTVLSSALLKYHMEHSDFDLAIFVVKSHHKINIQRSLLRLADINSLMIEAPKKRRHDLLRNIEQSKSGPVVVIINYEQFRVDTHEWKSLLEGRRTLIFWDEMPSKLKTRSTQLYKAVRSCLYRGNTIDRAKLRPASLRQYMLSATPIENNPEDFFNCMRLIDPTVFESVEKFRNEFVASYSWFAPGQPQTWHHLDRMGLKAAHVTHQVDKADSDIAQQFPQVIEEPVYIDWDSRDRAIYDKVVQKAIANLEEIDILASLSVCQMLCDSFESVNLSAAYFEAFERSYAAFSEDTTGDTVEPLKRGSELAQALLQDAGRLSDKHHTKLKALKELLEEHTDEKVLIFSSFNDGLLPILEDKLTSWGVTYVRYDGTAKEKQAAQDRFQNDLSIQAFVSSDMGSDSLSLEKASVVIHYDLPWKWSTLIQRQNRVHRVDSQFKTVRYYTLMMADSIEDRKAEIIQKKLGYHEGVFKGVIADQTLSARLTKADLLYILSGA